MIARKSSLQISLNRSDGYFHVAFYVPGYLVPVILTGCLRIEEPEKPSWRAFEPFMHNYDPYVWETFQKARR